MSDKITIGLTRQGDGIMDSIMETRVFQDKMDAARFAMALAINRGISYGEVDGTDTRWNVGSFDKDGQIRSLLTILYLEGRETPFRLVEHLIDKGLVLLKNYMDENNGLSDIGDLMES